MALGTIGLSTYRWNSSWKSVFLIILYPALSFWLFWWQVYFVLLTFQGRYTLFNHQSLSAETDLIVFGWGGLILGAGLVFWLIYSWRYHSSIIRGMAISRPTDAQAEPELYALLEGLCISQGIKTPDLEIIETPARNSFVTSDGEDASRIFITRGLIESLSKDEIEAVIAHEIAHLINNDTRLISFTIAFSDLVPYLVSQIQIRKLNESPAARNDIEIDEIAGAIGLFILLTPLWISYILTSIVRIFLFINREHDADAMALQITKNPDALMRALKRIHRRARLPYGSHDLKFLCIDNPAGGIFATHPRLHSRLALISKLSNCPVPTIENSKAAPVNKRFKENALLKRAFKQKDPNAPKPFNAPWKG